MSTCIILLKIKWFSHHRYPTLFSKKILRLRDCLNAHHSLEQVSNDKSYSVKYIICLMTFTFAILLSCNFFWLSLMHTNILNIPWKTVFFPGSKLNLSSTVLVCNIYLVNIMLNQNFIYRDAWCHYVRCYAQALHRLSYVVQNEVGVCEGESHW